MKESKQLPDWKRVFNQELERAQQARDKKNEGQARVCARRAAGAVVREYLQQRDLDIDSPSAYDLLKKLASMLDVSPTARQAAEQLILKVDESFKLPIDADLLESARVLARELLGE